MKATISIPNDVFREAERYAHKAGKTRSQLYSDAMRQYLLHHSQDVVTEAMNRACDNLGEQDDGFVRRASRKILKGESW